VFADQVDAAGGTDEVDVPIAAEDFGELLTNGVVGSRHGGECRSGCAQGQDWGVWTLGGLPHASVQTPARVYDALDRPTMPTLQGKFIVFDGGEGCGKSTQAHLLKAAMEAQGLARVLLVRDPGTTQIGEQIREVLLNPANDQMSMRCEMLLYMAARAQLMKETIGPALARGDVVVSDRFVSSTLAYQLGGDGQTTHDILRVAEIAVNHRWPDLTIILDMPIEGSSARVRPKFTLFPDDPDAGLEKDRIERRPKEYHEQVRRNYLAQAQQMPDRYRVVNADRTPAEVHADVVKAVVGLVGK
jgi:dTMP kinase